MQDAGNEDDFAFEFYPLSKKNVRHQPNVLQFYANTAYAIAFSFLIKFKADPSRNQSI